MPSDCNPNENRVRVIGIGNRWRGDDAAGLEVVDALLHSLPDGAVASRVEGDASSLLEALSGASGAVIVDAMRSGAPAGSVRRFDATSEPLPAAVARFSTHTLSLPDAIELARTLGHLPVDTVVYGIEGRQFEPGFRPCTEVSRGIIEATASVADEVERLLGRRV